MTHLINRSTLFDDLFRDVASGFYVKPLHGEALPKSVKVDVSDAGENYLIHAEIPGVSKEDIHVDIDGAKVSIKAGDCFTIDNLTSKRPQIGISPMEYWRILGKVSQRSYAKDEQIR